MGGDGADLTVRTEAQLKLVRDLIEDDLGEEGAKATGLKRFGAYGPRWRQGTPTRRYLFIVLCRFWSSNYRKTGRTTFWLVASLPARIIGLSKRWTLDHLGALEQAGWISRTRPKPGSYYWYELRLPETADDIVRGYFLSLGDPRTTASWGADDGVRGGVDDGVLGVRTTASSKPEVPDDTRKEPGVYAPLFEGTRRAPIEEELTRCEVCRKVACSCEQPAPIAQDRVNGSSQRTPAGLGASS